MRGRCPIGACRLLSLSSCCPACPSACCPLMHHPAELAQLLFPAPPLSGPFSALFPLSPALPPLCGLPQVCSLPLSSPTHPATLEDMHTSWTLRP